MTRNLHCVGPIMKKVFRRKRQILASSYVEVGPVLNPPKHLGPIPGGVGELDRLWSAFRRLGGLPPAPVLQGGCTTAPQLDTSGVVPRAAAAPRWNGARCHVIRLPRGLPGSSP